MPKRVCPYVGLVPYTEDDSRFFFGRERETRLVISNLFASRLTLLYGASGVGKSSVLRAGVLHQLQDRAAVAVARGEAPEQVVVYLKSWQGDASARFHGALAKALATTFPEAAETMPGAETDLGGLLTVVSDRFEIDLLVIFDQFEEYFLYHDVDVEDDPFARQLADAVNLDGLSVSFLLVLRDDSLSRLDRFKTRIPRLFSNYLRLRPLDYEAARRAIVEPVAVYNQLPSAMRSDGHVRFDLELVDAVLEQVQRGRVQVGEGGRGGKSGEEGIEAAFLQLVMTRVWEAEVGSGSRILRPQTLIGLGGAATIVRGHLDRVMSKLSAEEHRICAAVFQHLVTPSGTKIAHTATDLAELADIELQPMELLLSRISGSGMRLLTTLAPADAVAEIRYEIYHDALAQAMLDWRHRFTEEQEREELEAEARRQRQELERERRTARRLRVFAVTLTAGVVLALSAMAFAWFQMGRAEEQERRAVMVTMKAAQLTEQLQTTDAARAEEEKKRRQAEKEAAERAGDSERAIRLAEELGRFEKESQDRRQSILRLSSMLGAGTVDEGELATIVDQRLARLRRDRDHEQQRVNEAEEELRKTREDLTDALKRANKTEQELLKVREELTVAKTRIDSLEREAAAQASSVPDPFEIVDLGMRFVPILAERFQRGSPDSERGRHSDEYLHEVSISRGFWMSETEVTQGQWRSLLEANPSTFTQCGDNCPVETVNWFEAVSFANRLSKREKLENCYELHGCEREPGRDLKCSSAVFEGLRCQGYRLPTEAEWELAARAGTTTRFSIGADLAIGQANHDPFFGQNIAHPLVHKQTVEVRSYDPNPMGLFDMHGNVAEWIHDWYGDYPKDHKMDPSGPGLGSYRVVRGGGWKSKTRDCRSASRNKGAPTIRNASVGFRLVRTLPPVP